MEGIIILISFQRPQSSAILVFKCKVLFKIFQNLLSFSPGHRQYRVKEIIVLEVIWLVSSFFILFFQIFIVCQQFACVLQPFHLYVDSSLIDFETVFNELNFFAFDWHFYLSLKTKFKLLFSQFWKETPFNSSRTIGLWLLAHCCVLINIYIYIFITL